jgi:hypothetical protein
MRNNLLIIYYAIEDFKSFITFLQSEVWQYFSLIFEDMIENSKEPPKAPKNKNVVTKFKNPLKGELSEKELYNLQRACQLECESFVASLIHGKLCDTFFALYEVAYQEKDLLINQKLDSLQHCTPEQFGVSPKFLPACRGTEQPYSKSISLLEELVRSKGVMKKVEVLSCLREVLLLEIRDYRAKNRIYEKEQTGSYTEEDALEDSEWQPGADDATPVETYVFIKAQIRNHHAQFKYITDWKDENVRLLPVSHLITFYEGFLNFIEGEYISYMFLSL